MSLQRNKYFVVEPQAATNFIPYARFDAMIQDFQVFGGAAMAMSGEKTRRGWSSLKVSSSAGSAGVWYWKKDVLPGPVGKDSVLSLDIWGEKGVSATLALCDIFGAVLKYETVVLSGYWERVSIKRDFAGNVTFKVTMNNSLPSSIYLDGLQYEHGNEATTFFDRFTRGEKASAYSGMKDEAGFWRHYRSGRTRTGGKLVDLDAFGEVQADFGSGMGPFQQVYTEMANGGSFYRGMRSSARALTLSVGITGKDADELYWKRNELMKLVAPDRFDKQPLVIRYQGIDGNGKAATEPLDYTCVLEPSLANTPELPKVQKDTLNFLVMGGYPKGAYANGGVFALDQKFVSNNCIMRDADGVWVSMDTTSTVGDVHDVVISPDNRIYACGSGGIWRWDEDEWVSVGITTDGIVNRMVFAPDGKLVFGGSFTLVNGATRKGIASAVLTPGEAPVIGAFGSGLTNCAAVTALVYDRRGVLYAAGQFDDAGGVSNTRWLAKWNGSAWLAMSGSAMTGLVRTMEMFDQRWMMVGGEFAAGGANQPEAAYLTLYDTVSGAWKASRTAPAALNGRVWDIAIVEDGSAVLSGGFTKVGLKDCPRVAVYRNGVVSPLASGFEAPSGPNTYPVWAVAGVENRIYAGSVGSVKNLGSRLGEVAEYVKNAWRPLDIDLPDAITIRKILAFRSGELIIAGSWSGEVTSNGLTRMKQNVFDYRGSAVSYPVITITGPYKLTQIQNYTTGKVLSFRDLEVQAGETIELGLDPLDIYGKSSWAGRGNVLTYLMDGSDIGSFCLEPGENWIGINGEVPVGGLPKAHLTWKDVLWGNEGATRND